MPRANEISADLRRKVAEAYQSGQGYTAISKALGLNRSTVRAILAKWKKFGTVTNLPRSGRPAKISLQARRIIISEVQKNPLMTSRDLQASLASARVNVHDSTIRKTLCKNGRVVQRKPLFPKRNMAACHEYTRNLRNVSALLWKGVLWSKESKDSCIQESLSCSPEGKESPNLKTQFSKSAQS